MSDDKIVVNVTTKNSDDDVDVVIQLAPENQPYNIGVAAAQGMKGVDGKSAYQAALENNLTSAKTEKEWLLELGNSGGFVAEDFLNIYKLARG